MILLPKDFKLISLAITDRPNITQAELMGVLPKDRQALIYDGFLAISKIIGQEFGKYAIGPITKIKLEK